MSISMHMQNLVKFDQFVLNLDIERKRNSDINQGL